MSRDSYAYATAQGAAGGELAFVFHGTGASEAQLLPLARKLLPEATLVAPRGDVSENGALRFFRRTGEGRYDMADVARATSAMAEFVAAHVAERRPARVVGVGYSNGANILASVVFARRDLFDAVVLMHPLIPWTPEAGPVRTDVLVTAGRRDPICPPDQTKALASWFAANGAAVETVWHDGGHGIETVEIETAARFLTRRRVAAEGRAR